MCIYIYIYILIYIYIWYQCKRPQFTRRSLAGPRHLRTLCIWRHRFSAIPDAYRVSACSMDSTLAPPRKERALISHAYSRYGQPDPLTNCFPLLSSSRCSGIGRCINRIVISIITFSFTCTIIIITVDAATCDPILC